MRKLYFCNIGWMKNYEGDAGKKDKLAGGGRHVNETGKGGEVCNFIPSSDGFVYGYFSTWRGDVDNQINLEKYLDAHKDNESVSGVDIVWTATDRVNGGRRVVGWYEDATLFRRQQKFRPPKNSQHARDNLGLFRVKALKENVYRLDLSERDKLRLGTGAGWMGQFNGWAPLNSQNEEVPKFLRKLQRKMNKAKTRSSKGKNFEGAKKADRKAGIASPAPSKQAYKRYTATYEVKIPPSHDRLQKKFNEYLDVCGFKGIEENYDSIDLQYRDKGRGAILSEVKPCDSKSIRFAIRAAMGQLLDYGQRKQEICNLLVVVDVVPNAEDQSLATSNGFGIAFPYRKGFKIIWPQRSIQHA